MSTIGLDLHCGTYVVLKQFRYSEKLYLAGVQT